MTNAIVTIKRYLNNAIKEGILWIFGSSVFSQLCAFISSVVVIRHLSKANYGYYVDASNIYNYTAAFIGMGMTSAIIQFCSEKRPKDEIDTIYTYSLKRGLRFNFLLALIIIALAGLKSLNGQKDAAFYLVCMCLLPMVAYTNQYTQVVLRVKRSNKDFGKVNIWFSFSVVAGNIALTYLWGVTGLVISTYLSNAIASLIGFKLLKEKEFIADLKSAKSGLEKQTRTAIDKYALLCAVTNLSSSVLLLLDITCISAIIGNAETLAEYKVGSAIPNACMFIPTCLVTFYYPMLVERFSSNVIEFKSFLKKVTSIFFGSSFIVAAVLFAFSTLIIRIIYGEQYLSSAPIMRILCINYLISAGGRKLFGNLIAVFKKVSINLYFSLISGGINILLDIWLIKSMGPEGAAVATLAVTVFITLMEIAYIYYFLKKKTRDATDASV